MNSECGCLMAKATECKPNTEAKPPQSSPRKSQLNISTWLQLAAKSWNGSECSAGLHGYCSARSISTGQMKDLIRLFLDISVITKMKVSVNKHGQGKTAQSSPATKKSESLGIQSMLRRGDPALIHLKPAVEISARVSAPSAFCPHSLGCTCSCRRLPKAHPCLKCDGTQTLKAKLEPEHLIPPRLHLHSPWTRGS